MSSLNQCNFIGNFTRDIDLKYAPSGAAVASGSIACNHKYTNKTTGEKVDDVEYVNLTFFGKTAETVAKYMKKGSKIYVSGRMKTDKYDDKDGITRYSTKVIVNDMQFLDSRPDAEATHDRHSGGGSNQGQQSAPPADNGFNDIDF